MNHHRYLNRAKPKINGADIKQKKLARFFFVQDPDGYKQNKAAWADVKELGPLTNPQHVAYYQKLLLAVERVVHKMIEGKRQFNSLAELDNFLSFTLGRVQ